MATKSLYEMDDVCATLMYAFQTKNHTLAFETARELRVSDEMDLLVNLVTFAWLLCDPHVLPLNHVPTQDTILEDLCSIVNNFPAQLPKYKSPLLIPLPSSPQQAQEAVAYYVSHKCWKPCLRMLISFLHKDIALLQALLRDQCGAQPQMLEVLDRIVYQPLAERLLYHIVVLHITGTDRPSTAQKAPLNGTHKARSIWNLTTHGRAARTFHISSEALSAWNIRPKSFERLQGTLIPHSVMDTCRSLYWESTNPPPAEEAIESWFTKHFPDDIPDEWSRAEIEKSHVYEPIMIKSGTNEWHPAFLLCWS